MDRPTAAHVREWATGNDGEPLFNFAAYGYGEPAPGDPDRLEARVAAAVAFVEAITARKLDESLTDPGLVALAQDAVLMRTQQILVLRGRGAAVQDVVEQAGVSQLRAGDFSVTFRDPAQARKALQINGWGELSDTLLALATPERRAELLAELAGTVRPLGLVVETSADPLAQPGDVYGYE